MEKTGRVFLHSPSLPPVELMLGRDKLKKEEKKSDGGTK